MSQLMMCSEEFHLINSAAYWGQAIFLPLPFFHMHMFDNISHKLQGNNCQLFYPLCPWWY